jgi:hypothetical protein
MPQQVVGFFFLHLHYYVWHKFTYIIFFTNTSCTCSNTQGHCSTPHTHTLGHCSTHYPHTRTLLHTYTLLHSSTHYPHTQGHCSTPTHLHSSTLGTHIRGHCSPHTRTLLHTLGTLLHTRPCRPTTSAAAAAHTHFCYPIALTQFVFPDPILLSPPARRLLPLSFSIYISGGQP